MYLRGRSRAFRSCVFQRAPHSLSKKRITLSGRVGPSRPKTTQARAPSKQIQINPSKIAWISLDSVGRIGASQWVTRKKIKKTASVLARAMGCAERSRSPPAHRAHAVSLLRNPNIYHKILFSRSICSKFELSPSACGRPVQEEWGYPALCRRPAPGSLRKPRGVPGRSTRPSRNSVTVV